jgi:Bcr/CflA subfamily drug resistance transporter
MFPPIASVRVPRNEDLSFPLQNPLIRTTVPGFPGLLNMLRPSATPPRLATLVLLTAVSVLTLNLFLPSLAGIAREFEVSYVLASFSVSGYLAVTAVLQIVLGPLGDLYGRRPVLQGSFAVFAVASLVAALAPNIWVFLGARVVQAGVISGSILASAIITDTSERAKAASLMGYVSMAMALGPMLAPVIGGFLDEAYGWRAAFWLYTALGVAMSLLIWVDVGETNPAPAATFGKQMRAYSELFRSRRFWGYSFCVGFGIGTFFLFVSAAPLVATEVFGLNTAAVGIGIGSITGGFFFGSFLSGVFAARAGILRMMFIGRIAAFGGVALALIATLTLGAQVYVFFAGAICAGFGNGLSVPSARAGALSIRPHLAGSAAGLSGALTMAVGALVSSLPGVFITGENGAWLALLFMLGTTFCALMAVVYVWFIDQREGVAVA